MSLALSNATTLPLADYTTRSHSDSEADSNLFDQSALDESPDGQTTEDVSGQSQTPSSDTPLGTDVANVTQDLEQPDVDTNTAQIAGDVNQLDQNASQPSDPALATAFANVQSDIGQNVSSGSTSNNTREALDLVLTAARSNLRDNPNGSQIASDVGSAVSALLDPNLSSNSAEQASLTSALQNGNGLSSDPVAPNLASWASDFTSKVLPSGTIQAADEEQGLDNAALANNVSIEGVSNQS